MIKDWVHGQPCKHLPGKILGPRMSVSVSNSEGVSLPIRGEPWDSKT